MKYLTPEYKNEKIEANDVITSSFDITPGVNEDGEPTITVTGYLSNLLGNM